MDEYTMPARGCFYGMLFGLILWALIFWFVFAVIF